MALIASLQHTNIALRCQKLSLQMYFVITNKSIKMHLKYIKLENEVYNGLGQGSNKQNQR